MSFPLTAGCAWRLSRKFDNDITLAATYWGLQQWSVNRTIYGDPAGDTVLAFSPWLQLPTLLTGMDNSLGYTYSSQIENIEFNTMLRLNPADPYWEVNWLWGVRYIYFADNLTLVGSDAANSAREQLISNTTNNLIGAQTGLYFVRGWSHFQWESGLKVGLMANIYHQHLTDSSRIRGRGLQSMRHFGQRQRSLGPVRGLGRRPLSPHRELRAPLGLPVL